MKRSNLYAEKVYSDHPLGLWTFDDNIEFKQIFSSSQQNIMSENWNTLKKELPNKIYSSSFIWTTQNSNFGNSYSYINSVAYGNGLWVAGGYFGQLRTSTDAVTWVTQISNFGGINIWSIAYGNGLWVASGNYGQLRTSTNAVTWVTQTYNFNNAYIYSVAYGNGLWVAGGNYGQLFTSTNAVTWVTQTSNFGNTQIWSIAYGNGLWVAGGYTGQLRTSTDAVTWVTQISQFDTSIIYSVAYGNGLWVAGGTSGQLRTSTDAVTWVTQTSNFVNAWVYSVVYGNGLWMAGGDYGQLRTSTDAVTWVTQNSNFGNTSILSIAYGNSLWVAGGDNGQLRTITIFLNADINSLFSLNSISNFSNFIPSSCFSINVKPSSSNVYKIQIGVIIDSIEQYSEYFIDNSWNTIYHIFEIPNTESEISFFIKPYSTGDNDFIEIENVSLGQWSEDYIDKSTGFNDSSIPLEIESLISNNSSYTQTQLDAYGITPNLNGYYLINNNEKYFKPSGIPLVFGSHQSISIYEDPNGNPSIMFPSCGLFNESGKYNNYTLEFWMRAYNKSIDPIRILGPINSTDGVYLEEGFISIYVGPYTKSYFLGKYDRPMLVNLLYSETFVNLMINGQQVLSMDIDINNITFPAKEFDWFGIYGNNLVFPFEIDCISIYPYLMPSEMAKKHFIYGQGVEELYSAPSLLSKDIVQIDFPSAEYAFNVTYPDFYNWKDSFSVNTNTNSYILETAKYSLPEVLIKNNDVEIDESEWYLENRQLNNTNPDIFPYLLMKPNAINNYGSIYFDNLSMLTSKTESIFGIFKSPISLFNTSSLTWTTVYSGIEYPNFINYANNLYITGGGNGQLSVSTNSINWVTRNSGTNRILDCATYGNGTWVIGGKYGYISTSTNTITWITQNANINSFVLTLEYGNGLWMLGTGDTELRTSTDTITWITQDANLQNGWINCITYANNLWLLAADGPELRSSTDGITWITQNPNINPITWLNSIAYGNNIWLIGDNVGNFRTSTDAVSWVTQVSNLDGINVNRSISYGNGLWVAGGYNNQVRSSTDAITWVTESNQDIYQIVYSNNFWTIAGNGGIFIIQQNSPIEESKNIIKFINKNTNESISIKLYNNTIQYVYVDSLSNESILYSSASVSSNQFFTAGINISDFTNQYFSIIRNFFSNPSVISISIGGAENENTFEGKIYGIHLTDLFFHNKDLIEYFTNGIINQEIGISDLIKYIGNYSLLPVYKNITMGLDIGSSSYWEDVIPLSVFGKNIASGAGYVYDLDMIQFNIDSPYRQGIDESQPLDYYYYNLINYLSLQDKDYNYLQSLGYSNYQDLNNNVINALTSLKYSTSFNSFITIQDYLEAGNKKYSDFINTASADGSKVILPISASIGNTKYEIFDNHVIIIPNDIDFMSKYLGVHLDMKVRGTLEKNMGINRMQLSSFASNDGIDTKIGTKYSYPIYPKVEPE